MILLLIVVNVIERPKQRRTATMGKSIGSKSRSGSAEI
jgi:hypothetical protein